MEVIGPAAPAPSPEELIQILGPVITTVIQQEMTDEADIDRIWILRKIHKNYLYYRDLAYFAPSVFQGLLDTTSVDQNVIPENTAGAYDYTQNVYRGYCRKLVAVLGTRIPNATAVPDDPSSEQDQAAARAANNAAEYVRQQAELQVTIMYLVFKLYNFGTTFWKIEWEEDAGKYGTKEEPQFGEETLKLGADDPIMQGGFNVQAPKDLPPKMVPKGSIKIGLYDASEIAVPLDADGQEGVNGEDCLWLRHEREKHKANLLEKFGRDKIIPNGGAEIGNNFEGIAVGSLQWGEQTRSAMASPIGVVRPGRAQRWTVVDEYWKPAMYQLLPEKQARDLCAQNFPDGLQITRVRGRIVALQNKKLSAEWQECQPEPAERIMADPLGDDWVVANDLLNNLLNQENETVERSNDPGLADPSRVDFDAWQRRRSNPGDLIPATPPAGRGLDSVIWRPPTVEFSEQIPAFRSQIEETAKEMSGLTDPIWGGDTSDPTARQTELKTNAAIRQLGVIWVMIGKSLEKVYKKAIDILAEHEDGILHFAKENQFGKFDTVGIVMQDLKGGSYHFEADEAIPMTWGQQRDLVMWMMDKPEAILDFFGFGDPLNVQELKDLLGMPGMRIPHVDDREKGMNVIRQLLQGAPTPGQPQPDGSTGQPQPSIPPDWEDDSEFMAKLVKAWLTNNFRVAESNPDGAENVRAWGQAHEARAKQGPPTPKSSVAVSLKGEDLGDPAVQSALTTTGIIQQGTPVQAVPKPVPQAKPNGVPMPPGMIPPPQPLATPPQQA